MHKPKLYSEMLKIRLIEEKIVAEYDKNATPFGAYNFDFLEAYKRPKLFICSDNDFATKVEDTKVSTKKLSEPKELIIKTNTSHFYFGIEQELCQDVLRFLQQQQ